METTFEELLFTPPDADELVKFPWDVTELTIADVERDRLFQNVTHYMLQRQPGAVVWVVQDFVTTHKMTADQWRWFVRKHMMDADSMMVSFRAWLKFALSKAWECVWVVIPLTATGEGFVPQLKKALESPHKLEVALDLLSAAVRSESHVMSTYSRYFERTAAKHEGVLGGPFASMLSFLLTDAATLPTIDAMSSVVRMYDRDPLSFLCLPSMMLTLSTAILKHHTTPTEVDMSNLYMLMSFFNGRDAVAEDSSLRAGYAEAYKLRTITTAFTETWGMLYAAVNEWEFLDDDARRAVRYTIWKTAMQGTMYSYGLFDRQLWSLVPPLTMSVFADHKRVSVSTTKGATSEDVSSSS